MRAPRAIMLVLAACALFALTAIGCGGGGDGAASSDASGTASPAETTGAETSTSGAEPLDQAKVAWPSKPSSFDPLHATSFQDVSIVHLYGGFLYEQRASDEPVPGLASEAKTSPDDLTWTFTLRDGLKFSDGTPLTSADVKATIERGLKDETNAYAAFFTPIKAVTAPDPQTVVFKLSRPYPSLLTTLGAPEFAILPADRLNEEKFFNKPVSAGLYTLESQIDDDPLVFAANPNYWGTAPLVNEISFVTLPDSNTRLAQVQSGQVDIAMDLPAALSEQVQDPARASVVPLYGAWTLNFNNEKAPFDSVGVRRAISLAVDRAQISTNVYQDKVKPLKGLWPSTMAGYDESISTDVDLDGAKAALAGTQCESGCKVSLLYSPDAPDQVPMSLIIKDNLEEIGIDVTLDAAEYPTFLSRKYEGKYEMAFTILTDYSPVPDGLLIYGLLSDGGLFADYSRYSSPKMDGLVNTALESGGDERAGALSQIGDLFLEDVPYINLTEAPMVVASRVPDENLQMYSTSLLQPGQG
jgi:peptide/nickel transport system substrate-binding protein